MKQQKEHKNKLSALKKGDEVLTGGGLVGKIVKIDDNYADVQLAQGVVVKAVKSTIVDVIPPAGSKPAND
jgi:preprotein translocase subunit YajC